jgi:hypothetical protein
VSLFHFLAYRAVFNKRAVYCMSNLSEKACSIVYTIRMILQANCNVKMQTISVLTYKSLNHLIKVDRAYEKITVTVSAM